MNQTIVTNNNHSDNYKTALFAQIDSFIGADLEKMQQIAAYIQKEKEEEEKRQAQIEAAWERQFQAKLDAGLAKLDKMINSDHANEWV